MDSRGSRTEQALQAAGAPSALERRWMAYALMAGAGLAAAPEPAEALIQYTNPDDVTIFTGDLAFDLNGGGDDFKVNITNSFPTEYSTDVDLSVFGLASGAGVIGDITFASRLGAVSIGGGTVRGHRAERESRHGGSVCVLGSQ